MSEIELEDKPTRKRNRYTSKAPKPGLFWCDHCDACLVGEWEKCRVCGGRSGQKVRKSKDYV